MNQSRVTQLHVTELHMFALWTVLPGSFSVSVFGDFLPRHVFHRLHAVCAYLRCLYVALCVLLGVFFGSLPGFDVVFVDQVSAVVPLFLLLPKTKVGMALCYNRCAMWHIRGRCAVGPSVGLFVRLWLHKATLMTKLRCHSDLREFRLPFEV